MKNKTVAISIFIISILMAALTVAYINYTYYTALDGGHHSKWPYVVLIISIYTQLIIGLFFFLIKKIWQQAPFFLRLIYYIFYLILCWLAMLNSTNKYPWEAGFDIVLALAGSALFLQQIYHLFKTKNQ